MFEEFFGAFFRVVLALVDGDGAKGLEEEEADALLELDDGDVGVGAAALAGGGAVRRGEALEDALDGALVAVGEEVREEDAEARSAPR